MMRSDADTPVRQGAGAEFSVRFAQTETERRAAQALRYEVFVRELGGDGALVDHAQGLEKDRFDPFCDQLIVTRAGSDAVLGVYRLMSWQQAEAAGQFYSEDEFDLGPLRSSGRRLLELGRSCLHRDHRGGAAMHHLWTGLARHVLREGVEVLFGTASFHGTDAAALRLPLAQLHHAHLAPASLRVRARPENRLEMDLLPPERIDRRRAMLETPALIKAYLRLGGFVGDGAWLDHAFNTTDVCLILDTAAMNTRQAQIYTGVGKG